MRPAFQIDVTGHHSLVWHELSLGHALPLCRLFNRITADRARRLQDLDSRRNRTASADYKKEVKAQLFALRDFPFGIHQVLPAAAALAAPNMLRLSQTPHNTPHSDLLGRYHFAVLQDKATPNEAQALAVLERRAPAPEAELSLWAAPTTHRPGLHGAVRTLMQWGCQQAGYQRYIAHVQARVYGQRGNLPALMAARELGFRIVGRRDAFAPNGNGKTTHILRADNWQP